MVNDTSKKIMDIELNMYKIVYTLWRVTSSNS